MRSAGRNSVAKAAILPAVAKKCRDAYHLSNLVYDTKAVDAAQIAADLEEARRQPEPIPEYAFDCHTRQGRRRGKTRRDFFPDEHDALRPRQSVASIQ